jgi:hypothetical protein
MDGGIDGEEADIEDAGVQVTEASARVPLEL